MAVKKGSEKYQEALDELHEILEKLEGEEISVDELTDKVSRASDLIKWCDKQLKSTEEKIKKIIDDLDT